METPETKPETPAPTPEGKAEVAAAAAAIATEKLREARKAEQEKAAKKPEKPEAPEKARRVGPLRKIHTAAFKRNEQLMQPDLDAIRQLEEQIEQRRANVLRLLTATFDDVLQDLGEQRGKDDAWLVEEGGESYVMLGRAPGRQAQRQAPPEQSPKAPKAP